MAYTVQHTAIGTFPWWYHLDAHKDEQAAIRRANNYALDHGGFVCVKDATGKTVFGTDPVALDNAISNGTCQHFAKERARRLGCCV